MIQKFLIKFKNLRRYKIS